MGSLSFQFSLLLLSLSISPLFEEGGLTTMAMLGGVRDSSSSQNSSEIDGLARFAVEEYNKKEGFSIWLWRAIWLIFGFGSENMLNALLELARVVKAQEQLVAGTLHHLTLEAISEGKKRLYEAKVWVKPWLNFKELQEFYYVGDVPSITPSDLGVKKDGHEVGWKAVSVQDPGVMVAASHAVETIQKRSNSLVPYELQEILHAKAEVIEGSAKIDMLLKVKRGNKEEKFRAVVHKDNAGTLNLNQMEQDHS